MNLIRKKGFSLVELIVVVAIFGMLFVVISNTFFNSMKAAIKAEALKEVRQNGDVAMARMIYDIRKSTGYTCWKDASNNLVLILLNVDETTDDLRVGYRWNNNNLLRSRIINAVWTGDNIIDSKNVMLSSIPTTYFSCPDGIGASIISTKPLEIDFTLQYVPFGIVANLSNIRSEEKVEMRFRTTVVPRNTN
jgi:prepilin-type N-terminal cleavage/methylation domain-containing protein